MDSRKRGSVCLCRQSSASAAACWLLSSVVQTNRQEPENTGAVLQQHVGWSKHSQFLFPDGFVCLQNMGLPSVMVLPLLVVIAAGVYYIYNEVIHFMSKSLVRNKVVVITDAVSGVGTGKWFDLCRQSSMFHTEKREHDNDLHTVWAHSVTAHAVVNLLFTFTFHTATLQLKNCSCPSDVCTNVRPAGIF